jgi:hypothetical protein
MIRIAASVAIILSVPSLGHTQPTPMRSMRPPWQDDQMPVALHTPNELNLMSGPFRPGSPWSANLPYASNTSCGAEQAEQRWCGHVLLSLATGSPSEMFRDVWALRRRIEQGVETGYAFTSKTPPAGYTEAWEQQSIKPTTLVPFPVTTMLYLRTDSAGTPSEYVQCITAFNAPIAAPTCTVETTLNGASAVQIKITYSTRYWPEQDVIRAAVMRTVVGWR